MTRRISIPALLLAALALLPAAARAADRPDLEVKALPDPQPTGQAGDYGLRLRVTVVNDGRGKAPASWLRLACGVISVCVISRSCSRTCS